MNFIIEFYQSLDALNTIIFWGVIIVILLLLVFGILMINKNKKLKQELSTKNYNDELYSDEIALPSNSRDTLIMKDENLLIQEEKHNNFEPFVLPKENNTNEHLEVEKNFKVEEHVMEYDKDLFNLSHVKKNSELPSQESSQEIPKESVNLKIPTKPYERNVLREMSLSQTSPIGIVKRDVINNNPLNKSHEKQPSESKTVLTTNNKTILENHTEIKNTNEHKTNEIISKPTTSVDKPLSELKSESFHEKNIESPNKSNNKLSVNSQELIKDLTDNYQEESTQKKVQINYQKLAKGVNNYHEHKNKIDEIVIKPSIQNKPLTIPNPNSSTKPENEKFLEEISQKLAEAEIPNEIDRTEYELQQEEDAIISYKELMAKKDTIKTIDEEDAVISIKELTKRKTETDKLYNLTEEEENNEFIDELKKFRNDLN